MRISLIGLGLMGRPMARRMLATGYELRGWNRSPLLEGVADDIPQWPDLASAAQADICLLMLADSVAVAEVIAVLEPVLQAGSLVLDMGSSDPAHSREHATRLAQRGVGWVDAPVSGGPEGAVAGTLAIMVGGFEHDVARVMRILRVLGGNVVHVGGPGAGHTVKVINQLIVGLTIEAVAEGLALAEGSGVDPHLVQQALRGGFADSKILQIHGTRMINRTYTPGGKAAIQLKDLRLAHTLAQSLGLHLPHLESAIVRYEHVVEQGDGGMDHSVVHRLLVEP